MRKESRWVCWVREIHAIAQTGLTYCQDPYDIERYERLRTLSSQMFSAIGKVPLDQVTHFFIAGKGYCTPKVDLRAGIFRNNQILLVLERTDDRWTLPGGWADVNESPLEGIVREVKEEAGFEIDFPELIAVVDRGKHPYIPVYPDSIYKLFFYGKLSDGQVSTHVPNIETTDVRFFSKAEIPELTATAYFLPI